jgi:acyl-CoA thioesterase II
MADETILPPLTEAQLQARRDLLAAEHAKLTPAQAVANLMDLFALEEVEPDLYRVSTGDARGERLFGGQVIAQAMMAALKSAPDDKVIHSLHAYFLRGGSDQVPVALAVNRDFDGRSFANRRVVASQDGKVILNLAASFQLEQSGLDFQIAMPDVPAPDDCLPDYLESIDKADVSDQQFGWYARVKPIEIRNIALRESSRGSALPNCWAMWFRAAAPLPDDPLYHYAALAYASDYGLLGSSWMVHRTNGWTKQLASASLDHAVWFHARPKADEWMLYWMECQWTGGARGINRGQIFAADGTLMASTMQEGMIRAG